jgi:peptidoglycan/LPS O-acetylase OafA/YrhL
LEFRADINGLRAVAVVAVLFYHFALPGFGGGFAGVDIFFVLSGYLMTGILHGKLDQGAKALGGFYLARARRIVPALVVLCAAVLTLGWFWVAPLYYKQLASHAAASITFLSNILYWKQVNYFNPEGEGFWLLHTWTLSVEWQFYLLYPLGLLLLSRVLKGTDRRAMGNALLVVLVASLLLAVVASRVAPQAGFYLLPPRAWELIAGGVVWLGQTRFQASPVARRVLVSAGLVLLVASIVLLDESSPWATLLVAVPVAGTVLVLLGNAPTPVLGNPVFQALGRWSYSIYLWHWPISVFLGEWQPNPAPQYVAGALGVSVLFGWLSFRLVETPSRQWLQRIGPWTQGVSQFAVAAGVAALALSVVNAAGHPERIPATNAELYQRYAAERQHWAFPKECNVASHEAGSKCALGPADAPHVLVIGDSHAQQWYGWWADYVQSHRVHVEFFTFEGCSIGYDVEARPACTGFWKEAVAYVQASKADAIVVSSNWQVPAVLVEPYPPRQRMRERLPQILAAITRNGRPALITAAMPTVGRSTPDEITAHLFHDTSIDHLARWSCDDFARRAAHLNADLAEMVRSSGARLVDPAATMCDPDLVVVSSDHHLMFRDGNHVSTVASLHWGGGLFEPFLEELRLNRLDALHARR